MENLFWGRPLRMDRPTRSEEGVGLEDWLYVFTEDNREHEDEDDEDWEPPAKQRRLDSDSFCG